jgi:hypothetical protein
LHSEGQQQKRRSAVNAVDCRHEQEVSKVQLILAGRKRYQFERRVQNLGRDEVL